MKEIHPDYYVTEDGNIYSAKTKRMVAQRINHRGYKVVNLSINGKNKTFSVHRLVALAYIPNPNNLPVINHKNGIKTDNRVENLEWVTNLENRLHAIRNGLINFARGIRTRNGKFDEETIRKIRNLAREGHTYKEIAELYDVCQWAIGQIVRKDTYAWVN